MRWTGFVSRPEGAQALPASRLGGWVEGALLLALVIEIARLVWAVLAPVGPYGDWRARQPVILDMPARRALFAAFDPFYRTGAGSDGQQVTSLPLQLFGIRINEASGLGSAIIADADGKQTNYAVGDEIAPGVTLKAVFQDHVVIERGGVPEMLYIDQSQSIAPVANGGSASSPYSSGLEPLSTDALLAGISFIPRTENGQITGILVGAADKSDAFSRVGFHSGDIIVQINGNAVTASDLNNLHDIIHPGAHLSLLVERGAATVPIALIVPDTQ